MSLSDSHALRVLTGRDHFPYEFRSLYALMFIDAVRGDFGHTFDSIECYTQNF